MHKCKRKHTKSRLFIILAVLSHKPFPPHTPKHPHVFTLLRSKFLPPTHPHLHPHPHTNLLDQTAWTTCLPGRQDGPLALQPIRQLGSHWRSQASWSSLLRLLFWKYLDVISTSPVELCGSGQRGERRLDVWGNLRCDYVALTGKG